MKPISRNSLLVTRHPSPVTRYLFTFYLFTLLPLTALSWGASGHRVIGEITESLLTDKARKEVVAIFGNSSVAMMSVWGDTMRSDSTYNHTWLWHYTNLDSGLVRTAFDTIAIKQNSGENVYRVMELTAHLKRHPKDTNMLKMLVHIVQDMHCPMHLARAEDLGGNQIKFRWFGRDTNLHSLWDDGFIDFQKLSYTEYANHLQRVHPLRKVVFKGDNADILNWAWDTYQTTAIVYDSQPYLEKPYIYNFKYSPLLEKRLVTAAEHLAAILNYIYN